MEGAFSSRTEAQERQRLELLRQRVRRIAATAEDERVPPTAHDLAAILEGMFQTGNAGLAGDSHDAYEVHVVFTQPPARALPSLLPPNSL